MYIENRPCKTGNSDSKRGNIVYYRNNFLFLKEHHPKPGAPSNPNTPSGVTQVTPGTSNCRWTWDVDTDSATKPLSIAIHPKCTNCDLNKCHAIIYNHNVLVEQQDCKTGEVVWTWRTKAMPSCMMSKRINHPTFNIFAISLYIILNVVTYIYMRYIYIYIYIYIYCKITIIQIT